VVGGRHMSISAVGIDVARGGRGARRGARIEVNGGSPQSVAPPRAPAAASNVKTTATHLNSPALTIREMGRPEGGR